MLTVTALRVVTPGEGTSNARGGGRRGGGRRHGGGGRRHHGGARYVGGYFWNGDYWADGLGGCYTRDANGVYVPIRCRVPSVALGL